LWSVICYGLEHFAFLGEESNQFFSRVRDCVSRRDNIVHRESRVVQPLDFEMLGSRPATLFDNPRFPFFIFLLPAPPIRTAGFIIRARAAFTIKRVFVILLANNPVH